MESPLMMSQLLGCGAVIIYRMRLFFCILSSSMVSGLFYGRVVACVKWQRVLDSFLKYRHG